MAEWLKAHDSKSCGQKCLGGSNPPFPPIRKEALWAYFMINLIQEKIRTAARQR